MKVFKFGGASVKNAEAVKNIGAILKKYQQQNIVVVVSAMGKSTNKLELLTDLYFHASGDKGEAIAQLEAIKKFHFDIIEQLFTDKKHAIYDVINNTFVELDWIIEDEPTEDYNREYDQIVSIGEIVSTQIINAYLNELGVKSKWVDVRGLIQTDDAYMEATVDWGLTQMLVDKDFIPLFAGNGGEANIVVTQGFIGGTSENFTATLGREGSDYSAAILAYACNAESVTIWKDVPGVLNADPKWFDDTKKIDHLSYHDAIELAYYGATVIHPKTIKPLQNKKIVLYVRSFLNTDELGTVINQEQVSSPIPSFIFKVGQVLISILPRNFSFIVEENLSSIFKLFADHQVKINVMQNSAINFSICVDNNANRLPGLLECLQKEYKVLYNQNVELITIRHYDQTTIDRAMLNKKTLLEVKSRHTAQMVVSS